MSLGIKSLNYYACYMLCLLYAMWNLYFLFPEINDQISYKTMIFVILHLGEIAKRELDVISHHSLFANLKEKINSRGDTLINVLNSCLSCKRNVGRPILPYSA